MILLMAWALLGVALGYEAARHGVVQIVVPTLYLFAMFLWAVAGLAVLHYVTSRTKRPTPTPEQVRAAWARMSSHAGAQERDAERK